MKNVLVVENANAGRKKSVLYKKNVIRFLFDRGVKFKSISLENLHLINIEDFDTVPVLG